MFGGLGRLKQFAEQAVVLASETVQQAENAIDRVADNVPLAGTVKETPAPSEPLAPTKPATHTEENGLDEPEGANGHLKIVEPASNGDNSGVREAQAQEQASDDNQAKSFSTTDSKSSTITTDIKLEQEQQEQEGERQQQDPQQPKLQEQEQEQEQKHEQKQQEQPTENDTVVIKTPSSQATGDINEVLLRAEKAEAVARKLSRVVKIRELQLEKQALESSELQVSNTNLSRVVEQLQSDIANLEKEKKQQTASIEQLQQQARDALQERNQLRKMKDQTEGSLGLLVAKDEQIAAVLKEGEILSKKQGLQVESIRRLRKELSDKEKEKEELKTTLGAAQSRVESLEEQLRQAQGSDAKRADSMVTQTAQIEQLNLALTEMQATLKAAEGVIAEHKATAESHVVRTSEKDKLIEKLNDETRALEQERDEFARRLKEVRDSASGTHIREDALLRNVTELQAMISVKSNEHHGQVIALNDEIRRLQDKYRAAEARCEELMSAVPEATRPLLRQIQSLQTTMDERASVWCEVESNWRKRLREAELALANAKGEKDSLIEASQAHEVELAERDTKFSLLKERFTGVENKLEQSQKRVQDLETQVQSLSKQISQLEDSLVESANELKTSNSKAKKLEENIQNLQAEVQAERTSKEQLQRRLMQQDSVPVVPQTPVPAAPVTAPNGSESLASLLSGDSMSSIETLRALVKQKDGEIGCLRSQMRALDGSLLELQEQLVAGQNNVRMLEEERLKYSGVAKKLKALSLRHAAALQLIGEKDEQLQDLQADLTHVKEMFQRQIQDLKKT